MLGLCAAHVFIAVQKNMSNSGELFFDVCVWVCSCLGCLYWCSFLFAAIVVSGVIIGGLACFVAL